MYGLRSDIDLRFLNGREVIQVAIGMFQTQFAFDEDVTTYVEGEFNYFDGKTEVVWRPEPGFAHIAARTVALLGARIDAFTGDEHDTLKLTFSNGHLLTIPDTSKERESYQITKPGHIIVV